MNSNFEAILLKYYKGKLLADRNCAIIKSRNDVLLKYSQVCFIIDYNNKHLFNND